MILSKRMQMIADMAEPVSCMADIGTDHGYIPIYLVQQQLADRAIACDVRKGPLSRAREHVKAEGLSDKILLRLGDGLQTLSPGEADAFIIAGMGGLLMTRILSESPRIPAEAAYFLLQPQSDQGAVRRYLHQAGFQILDEDMTIEDGKYYTVMKCRRGEDQLYTEADCLYGRILIEKRHPVLRSYLTKHRETCNRILDRLAGQDTEKSQERRQELIQELVTIREALDRMERSR